MYKTFVKNNNRSCLRVRNNLIPIKHKPHRAPIFACLFKKCYNNNDNYVTNLINKKPLENNLELLTGGEIVSVFVYVE